MNLLITAGLCGIIFGLGLSISQMVQPEKVLGFLDIAGDWDPSLAVVMVGALSMAFPGFRWVRSLEKPLLEPRFHITDKSRPDKPLLIGATLFGMGWGMTGYCPGPAFAGIALFNPEALLMVTAIYAGFWAAGRFNTKG